MSVHWHSYPDPQATAEACARHVLALLGEALSGRDIATLAISGGTTPALLFDAMAKASFDWTDVHLFWVDERAVPPGDAASNYRLANEHLIAPARIHRRNVHRIQAELTPDRAASRYVEEIRDVFRLNDGDLPHFDVIHLGTGADCHTASLFPGEPLIDNRDRIAGALWAESKNQWRISLLPGTLLACKHAAFLVCGDDKAEAVRTVFREPYDPKRYPAQMVSHHCRRVTWFLDEPAARLMDSSS